MLKQSSPHKPRVKPRVARVANSFLPHLDRDINHGIGQRDVFTEEGDLAHKEQVCYQINKHNSAPTSLVTSTLAHGAPNVDTPEGRSLQCHHLVVELLRVLPTQPLHAIGSSVIGRSPFWIFYLGLRSPRRQVPLY